MSLPENETKHPPDAEGSQSDRNMEPKELEEGSLGKEDETEYPGMRVVIPAVFATCMVVFLTALDRTIIGTAVTTISDEFNSFNDISWYESAYLLTFAALQLPMGKFYTFFPAKWTFISVVVVFEVGSIICAAAPTSTAFITGRAIAGVGAAGLTTGALVIFVDLLPLEKRPKYMGLIGATFGVASIAGPLLGGVFTTKSTWRWCFWINAPIGGLALLLILLVVPAKPPAKKNVDEPLLRRIRRFDPIGTALVVPGLTLLLLGLQWGGSGNAWGSTRVVVTLVIGFALLVAFAVSQYWVGEDGTMPPRIVSQRSIAAGSVTSLGLGAALVVITFYLPIWYQAIQGLSAVDAGIRMIAYFLTSVFFVIISGILVSKTGYYTPWLIAGTGIIVVGCGLLTTFHTTMSTAASIGYQVVVGAGIGMSLAQVNNAAQTVLSREDIPVGVTVVNFANFLGGTIFVGVCQGVLSSTLTTRLTKAIPGFDVESAFSNGATDLAKLVPPDQLPIFQEAYNYAIVNTFYVALGVSALAFVASWFLEWRTVKKQDGVTGTPG